MHSTIPEAKRDRLASDNSLTLLASRHPGLVKDLFRLLQADPASAQSVPSPNNKFCIKNDLSTFLFHVDHARPAFELLQGLNKDR